MFIDLANLTDDDWKYIVAVDACQKARGIVCPFTDRNERCHCVSNLSEPCPDASHTTPRITAAQASYEIERLQQKLATEYDWRVLQRSRERDLIDRGYLTSFSTTNEIHLTKMQEMEELVGRIRELQTILVEKKQ